jgi:ATP-binding cassette subfamily F protein 3
VPYLGNYAYYLEKKEEEAELVRQAAMDQAKTAKQAANREKQQAKKNAAKAQKAS